MPDLPVSHVFDADVRNFQTEVIERSRDVPVLVVFFADQVPVSAETRRHLERLADSYGGKFRLARVDVARDPTLAQHLRVQNLPNVKVVKQGQLVDELDGPQGERVLRQLIDQHTMSSGELVKQELAELLARRDFAAAQTILRQALVEEPNNMVFKVELADVLAQTGDLAGAKTLLAAVPEATDERERPQTRIELLEEVATAPTVAALKAKLADNKDLESRYAMALHSAAAGDYEAAMDFALEVLRADRTYREELGRRTLVRLFNLLPKGSETVKRYRRQLFNLLH